MNSINLAVNSRALVVLLLDDDQVFRGQLARAIRRRGYQVLEASNVASAIVLIDNQSLDLAVLDLKLEHESGLTVLKELQSRSPETRAIVLTGYGTVATAVDALKLGAVNYVTKPANADQILAAFDNNPIKTTEPVKLPSLEQVEWDYVQRVIAEHEGNLTRAAKALGLHRRSLQRKLAKVPGQVK